MISIRVPYLFEASTVLSWRNDPKVIRGALIKSEIPQDVHANWFKKMVETSNIFIAELRDEPIGVVCFDRKNEDEFEEATWSFYVVPEHQGKRLGKTVGELGLLAAEHRNILAVYADVTHENHASLQLHSELGFEVYAANNEVVKLYKEIY